MESRGSSGGSDSAEAVIMGGWAGGGGWKWSQSRVFAIISVWGGCPGVATNGVRRRGQMSLPPSSMKLIRFCEIRGGISGVTLGGLELAQWAGFRRRKRAAGELWRLRSRSGALRPRQPALAPVTTLLCNHLLPRFMCSHVTLMVFRACENVAVMKKRSFPPLDVHLVRESTCTH